MTYPHIEPSQKNDLPDYLQEAHVKRVFEVNNAVMEAFLNCEAKGADCLKCGNAKCFMVFEAQAELQGMTLSELMEGWRKQRELDRKAAEEQTKRFAEYQRRFEELQASGFKKVLKSIKSDKQPNLFEHEKAA